MDNRDSYEDGSVIRDFVVFQRRRWLVVRGDGIEDTRDDSQKDGKSFYSRAVFDRLDWTRRFANILRC